MKTALITGVSGQDGAYLSQLLLKKGYKVVGITRSFKTDTFFKLSYLSIKEDIILEQCDLLDISRIINLFEAYNPDEVYNLSAQSSVGASFSQPIGTIHYNIISTLNLLEAIRILRSNTRFYQASSSEMFGKVEQLPVKLSTPMHPLSPYAISKASAYWTTINYRESYQIYASNGILFNHESFLRGKNFFIKKVIRESLNISNGTAKTLSVGNIDVKRDFGYAPKYVEAMWLSLQTVDPDDYIICSGRSYSLREIIYYIFDFLGIAKSCLIEDPKLYRPSEIDEIYGNASKAKDRLGWVYEESFFCILDLLIEEEKKYMEK